MAETLEKRLRTRFPVLSARRVTDGTLLTGGSDLSSSQSRRTSEWTHSAATNNMIHAKQAQVDMEPRRSPEQKSKEPVEAVTEEQFLKDLYLYMKKRDTPIERIPHLGFKQIDLFLMFNTVRDLGGYHQVTSQQLWKQVYNTLGGNPRSTSAATCTRRHYEKLLLPYECHVKGISMNALPQHPLKHQRSHFHGLGGYYDDDDDGPGPEKRRPGPLPLPQSLYHPKPEGRGKVFPMPVHYPHYYSPILPPYIPTAAPVMPHSPPAPRLQAPFPPSPTLAPPDSVDSLELLRGLADRYKNQNLNKPLNLSTKVPSHQSNHSPVSSFSSPSSKFLNGPSTLYTARPLPPERKVHETQDSDAAVDAAAFSPPKAAKDAYVVDATPASRSPTCSRIPALRTEDDTVGAQRPSSPKPDFLPAWPKQERDGSPEVKRVDLSRILPSLPRDKAGKMEIEIPLSVLHKWLTMCPVEPPSAMRGPVQPAALPNQEQAGQRHFPESSPVPVPAPMIPQEQSPAAEDPRLRRRSTPSSATPPQAAGSRHRTSPNHFPGYKSGGIVKHAFSRDVHAAEQQEVVRSYARARSYWEVYNPAGPALKTSPGPVPVYQDHTATGAYTDAKDRPDVGPSTVVMVNSMPGSVLHLTTEEVMKLKRIISSSS